MTAGQPNAPGVDARRALVLHDRPLVVDLITLTLNHGVFAVRAASNLPVGMTSDRVQMGFGARDAALVRRTLGV